MLSLVLALVATAASVATPPAPTRWVEDHAQLLSPQTRASLDATLESYQRATGHQVVVWIGRTIDGASLAEWSAATFAAWKLGRAGVDDGLAMFVLADDRAIAIEVGYGLEDKVPDAIASRIIREVMTPELQAGHHDAAITAGVQAVLASIEGKPWTATAPPAHVDEPRPLWEWIGLGILGAVMLFLFLKHPRLALWMIASTIGRGGGSSNGGFSGGGGRSGGGGARGRW